jgi:glycosyltransferase involved in cell wall biosynthesis
MTSIDKINRGATTVRTERRRALRELDPSLEGAGVWLIVPCYKVRSKILDVIAKTPPWIEGIVCVDDACPEGSGDFIEANTRDPRVTVVRLPQNQGVGGATLAGYREAAARGGQVLVKVDGDDQMDLAYVSHLVAPILLGEADYAKGNRFTSVSHLTTMPQVRVFGNAALSFAAKLSTGYWNIFDPTNGFTAIEGQVAKMILEKRVSRGSSSKPTSSITWAPCARWCAMCRCPPGTPTRSRTFASAPSSAPSR